MNKFLIAMMAVCGCMMVNAEGMHCRFHSGDCTDTHCRTVGNRGGNRNVANLHAKIDAVRTETKVVNIYGGSVIVNN